MDFGGMFWVLLIFFLGEVFRIEPHYLVLIPHFSIWLGVLLLRFGVGFSRNWCFDEMGMRYPLAFELSAGLTLSVLVEVAFDLSKLVCGCFEFLLGR